MDNNNFQNFSNINSPKNIQILTMVINNNIYNLNDFTLNNILLPFLLHNNKQNYFNPQKNAFIFPEPIDIDSLQLFCNFLLTPEKVDMTINPNLKKILNVCVFFNAIEIINNIIQKYIINKLNKENSLDIILLIKDFIYSDNENIKNIFSKIINEGIEIIASNFVYYINSNKLNELYSLNGEIMEKIIEMFFKENNNKIILSDDIRNILELLMYCRGISNDIFLLLESERKKAINNFESLFNKKNNNEFQLQPTFTWKIVYDDIKKHNYQEAIICFENLNILLISYYDNVNDSFQLAIQILDINSSNNSDKDKNDKEDQINKDELLNTSTAKKIITHKNYNNNNNLLLSNNSLNSQNSKKEKENILINILSLCEISEINFKSHINFNGIYTKNNSRFLICKIENFIKKLKNMKKKLEFNLKIYFSRNYIFPKTIEYICQNFDKFYNLDSINKIPRSAMNILLKNEKMINVKNNENYKLSAIENWIKYKNGYISKKYIDIFKNIDFERIDNYTLIDFFMKNAKLISKNESLKNDIFYEIQRRFQEEYLSYYITNKTFFNKSNNKSISISNNYEDNNNINIDKNNYNNYSLSFTYDFLTRIISNLISYNKDKNKIYYANNNDNNIIDINLPISQRNNIPKNKICKNISGKISPILNDYKKNYKNEINKNKNKIMKKNDISNSNNHSNNNSNIPTNRYEKKSSNNSLSSYKINQINISGFSGLNYLNPNPQQNNNNKENKNNIDKKEINSLVNKGIKSFTPNNSKGRFVVKNNNKYNRALTSKPSKIQYKKGHSNSVDRFFSDFKEDKNNINIPCNFSDKKTGLFPNYIKNIQNDRNKMNQSNKRYHSKNNSTKISIQYYSNDKLKNNIKNKNDKLSLIICRNEDILSNKNKSKKYSKYKTKTKSNNNDL